MKQHIKNKKRNSQIAIALKFEILYNILRKRMKTDLNNINSSKKQGENEK